MADLMVDSAEGIAQIVRWARAHGYVLNEYHKDIADRHDVATEGVTFAMPIPSYPSDSTKP